MPLWHDGSIESVAAGEPGPVVWSVPLRTPAAVRPTAGDLRDAARKGDGSVRLARRLLARALLARMANVSPDAVRLTRSTEGAPQVEAPFGWHVSLSGGGQHALIAIGPQPVAVDCEPMVDAPILWDMLSADEAATIRSLPSDRQSLAWLQRWTVKEAHAKLIGTPRVIRPEAIDTVIEASGQASASFDGQSEGWSRIEGGAIETVLWWKDGCPPAVTADPNASTPTP